MSDEYEVGSLKKAMESGDRRTELIGMRDYIIHQLEDSRCGKCLMSQLKAGEQAALLLRLQQITEEISKLPVPDKEVKGLALIRGDLAAGLSAPQDQPHPDRGSKRSERRSTSRRTSKPRGA